MVSTSKRHHEQNNSYKIKHLFLCWLIFPRLSAFSTWQEAQWHAGRHGAAEVTEYSTCGSAGSKESDTECGLGF